MTTQTSISRRRMRISSSYATRSVDGHADAPRGAEILEHDRAETARLRFGQFRQKLRLQRDLPQIDERELQLPGQRLADALLGDEAGVDEDAARHRPVRFWSSSDCRSWSSVSSGSRSRISPSHTFLVWPWFRSGNGGPPGEPRMRPAPAEASWGRSLFELAGIT